MTMFQLLDPTRATSVTLRREMHGDDRVPATSIGLKIVAPNTLLDELAPGMLAMFYQAAKEPPDEPEFAEVESASLPLLRLQVFEQLIIKGESNGWKLHIDYGIDEASAIVLTQCKCDKFRVALEQGGSIELRLRVGTSEVDDVSLGKLGMLLDREVSIKLTAPERKPEPIDASSDAKDLPLMPLDDSAESWPFPTRGENLDATAAFVAAHGDGGSVLDGTDRTTSGAIGQP